MTGPLLLLLAVFTAVLAQTNLLNVYVDKSIYQKNGQAFVTVKSSTYSVNTKWPLYLGFAVSRTKFNAIPDVLIGSLDTPSHSLPDPPPTHIP